ncbi:MAG: DUF4185 domain-containing protein [Rhodothermales bacterium]
MTRAGLMLILISWMHVACDTVDDRVDSTTYQPIIQSARAINDHQDIPRTGDLWMTTWSDDDALYLTWGDGTGRLFCLPSEDGEQPIFSNVIEVSSGCFSLPGPLCSCDQGCDIECELIHLTCNQMECFTQCQPLCPTTDAGLLRLEGPVNAILPCEDENDCITSLHIPASQLPDYGWVPLMPGKNDKPSSLLFLDGRLLYAGHRPAGEPTYGYIAHSDDYGRTWTEVESSPWGANSNFRVAMFINMGQAYGLNKDNYVYALGVSHEISQTGQPMSVYLARVPRASVIDYTQYEYFAGLDSAGDPVWESNESGSVPLANLRTLEQASAMYHEGIDRYLFLTAQADTTPRNPGALFEAPTPWGPWVEVAEILVPAENPTWLRGHYIASLITKGAGSNSVFFTIAGGIDEYNLHIGQIEFERAR